MLKEAACIYLFLAVSTRVSGWTYSAQDQWDENCLEGWYQSPIDIITADATKENLGSFEFTNYDVTQVTHELRVEKESVSIYWPDVTFTISGAGLNNTYELLYAKFHWGSDFMGSEHLVDGQQSALELQLYHWDTSYSSPEEAYQNTDGFAVLSVRFDVGPPNSALGPFIAKFTNLVSETSHTVVEESLPELIKFLPADTSKFYRYSGSDTVPDCNESVIWTVFADTQTVSPDQINEFRKIVDPDTSSPILFNFRTILYWVDSSVFKVTYSDGEDVAPVCGFCTWIESGTWCST